MFSYLLCWCCVMAVFDRLCVGWLEQRFSRFVAWGIRATPPPPLFSLLQAPEEILASILPTSCLASVRLVGLLMSQFYLSEPLLPCLAERVN